MARKRMQHVPCSFFAISERCKDDLQTSVAAAAMSTAMSSASTPLATEEDTGFAVDLIWLAVAMDGSNLPPDDQLSILCAPLSLAGMVESQNLWGRVAGDVPMLILVE